MMIMMNHLLFKLKILIILIQILEGVIGERLIIMLEMILDQTTILMKIKLRIQFIMHVSVELSLLMIILILEKLVIQRNVLMIFLSIIHMVSLTLELQFQKKYFVGKELKEQLNAKELLYLLERRKQMFGVIHQMVQNLNRVL